MSQRGKKLPSLWYCCENCGCILGHKHLDVHLKSFCPQSTEQWSSEYGFILNKSLYSTLEETTVENDITHLTNDVIFLSQSALQLCQLAIGDKVVVKTNNCTDVKTVWPTAKGSITSVYCTKIGLAESWGLKLGPVIVYKFQLAALPASVLSIEVTKPSDVPKATEHFLINTKHKLQDKIVTVGLRLSLCFYGRRLRFIVTKVESVFDEKDEEEKLTDDLKSLSVKDGGYKTPYKVCNSTKLLLVQPKQSPTESDESSPKLGKFGGYKEIVEDLKEAMSYSLKSGGDNKGMKLSSGVLIYGLNGTGKSHLAQALIQELKVNSIKIQSGDVFSKLYGETEASLQSSFKKAVAMAPCVIVLDDVETLCSKRKGSNQESRVVATVLALMDSLQDENVFIIAITSQPHLLEPALRRPGRLDREIELPVPLPSDRKEILQCLLDKAGCGEFSGGGEGVLDATIIESVANAAHGFVAADLSALLSHAQVHARRDGGRARLSAGDLEWALTQVKPSAMREISVQVPNVQWSDIGGQEDLKLKLKQTVEWPIRHPEAFVRLGINPPKGVLMYGPPGCSKTMIAKALATESKLNFISIKGSELFSKWVGESERAVRATFKRARSVAPSVVFFDEIDALAGERSEGGTQTGGARVQERVLAQLLTELDGVEPLGNVAVIAATNRPDRIDKALLRPGRLDRLVYVPLPDLRTRKQILQLQFRKTPISDNVDVDQLSCMTDGYSGAEVVAVCQEAAMSALEENTSATEVDWRHFERALGMVTPRTSKTLLELYESYRSH